MVEGTPDALKAQLRGHAVRLELREPVGETGRTLLTAALTAVPGVHEALCEGRRISRPAMSAHPDPGDVLGRGGALPALAVAAVRLSIRTFRSCQRSV